MYLCKYELGFCSTGKTIFDHTEYPPTLYEPLFAATIIPRPWPVNYVNSNFAILAIILSAFL